MSEIFFKGEKAIIKKKDRENTVIEPAEEYL